MKRKRVDSKDMIKFVNHILDSNNHFNMVVRVPERCNGQYISIDDLRDDYDYPSISCKYSNIYIQNYQVSIVLRKYTAFRKKEDGKWIGNKHYKVIFNDLESYVTLEEFTELYNSMIRKKIELYHGILSLKIPTDMSVFNFVVGKDLQQM